MKNIPKIKNHLKCRKISEIKKCPEIKQISEWKKKICKKLKNIRE